MAKLRGAKRTLHTLIKGKYNKILVLAFQLSVN